MVIRFPHAPFDQKYALFKNFAMARLIAMARVITGARNKLKGKLLHILPPPKRLHRSLSGLIDTFGAKNFFYRQKKDFYVYPEGAMIDIPDVEFKFFLPADGISAIYLRPTRNAWPDVVSPLLGGIVQR